MKSSAFRRIPSAQGSVLQGSAFRGSALVTTLLVITVLTIIVVAFMQSMAVERKTSQSYSNLERSRLAAQAGAELATARITELLRNQPFYAIGSMPDADGNLLPVFLGAETFSEEPKATYLISTPELSTNLPNLTPENSIDLNSLGGSEEPYGWLGTPIVKTDGSWAPQSVEARAPWIEILRDPTLPNQPDPTQPNYNPVIQRFAFWVEDETAKIDLLATGNADGPGGLFERSRPTEPFTPPQDLDLGALPWSASGTPLANNGDAALNQQVVEFLQEVREIPTDPLLLNQFREAPNPDNLAQRLKFHTTLYSRSNELAGTGKRRANLNHIVTDSMEPNAIAADLADIAFVISGKQLMADSATPGGVGAVYDGLPDESDEEAALPDFGSRFYANPTSAHEEIYLLRIAANIRDYVDEDSQPTFVNEAREVEAGARKEFSWAGGGTAEVPQTLGKEAIPYFHEHVWRGRLDDVQIIPGTSPSNRRMVSFTMDHYFEFYNPTTKDWTAPAGTYLKVYNLHEFEANQFAPIPLEDFELDLSGLVFPAAQAVVITTSPAAEDPPGLIDPGAVVYRPAIPASARVYSGHMGNRQVGSDTGNNRRFGIRFLGRTTDETDYENEFVFGTPQGVLDASPHVSLVGTGSPFEFTRSVSGTTCTWGLPAAERDRRFIWASSLRGNDAVSRSGDPRSVSEALGLYAGSNTAEGSDQARFFANYSGGTPSQRAQPLPGSYSSGRPRITLGSPANPEYVAPANWPDYHVSLTNSRNTAYAVIADAPMRSIGELGHIYDPHRKVDPSAPRGILTARGGGRSLKIGQPDDLVGAASRFTPAWFNGAWRLTDIFSADPDPDKPESDPWIRGKININGVLRDGGTAFRAALRGLQFLPAPDGDTARASQLFTDAEIDELIKELTTYLQKNGPMMCRGELGQLAFFASGTVGGQSSATSIDRSREEIFRRVVEIITTRSLSYRIFVVGQSITQRVNGTKVPTGTSRLERAVIFEPVIADAPNARVTHYAPTLLWQRH